MAISICDTWPNATLLPALRQALDDADDALLCVAFAKRAGVHLLERQLERLGDRTRLLVTTRFERSDVALVEAAAYGARVRVLNLVGATYHPKLYLTASGSNATAAIGSANLTAGLVSNVEVAVVVDGSRESGPAADAWALGERLWAHPHAVEWTPTAPVAPEAMQPDLLAMLRVALPVGTTIATLDQGRPNRVADVTAAGVWMETERSRARGRGPQLVDSWMLELGWSYLQAHGALRNTYLLNGLNVKRSSAVCAMLAQLPGVVVHSRRPIELRLSLERAWRGLATQDGPAPTA